jgi:hypothetical protein
LKPDPKYIAQRDYLVTLAESEVLAELGPEPQDPARMATWVEKWGARFTEAMEGLAFRFFHRLACLDCRNTCAYRQAEQPKALFNRYPPGCVLPREKRGLDGFIGLRPALDG